jgi:uncharacterized membrane protein
MARFAPLALIDRLLSTYWFVPSIVTVAAVGCAVLFTWIDRWYPDVTSWLGWAYGGGPEGARALLSAVAGSTITVVSVTFSVMVVALTVSSQHFGPRLLNSFMRDNASQLVLGTFTGTFAYCLVVLRTVQGDGDDYSLFVPHFAVAGAVALTLLSVAMLIYYVHHVAMSMQVSDLTTDVTNELERAIDRLYPVQFGEGTEPAAERSPPIPAGALEVRSPKSGYIHEVVRDTVLDLASKHHTTIWLTARPGHFVVAGTPVAAAHPPPADVEAFAKSLGAAFVFGTDRTPYQDVGFSVQQLVEMALRALSPGVNEPFTAITCIDRLGQGLTKLAKREIPSAVRQDGEGKVRVVAQPVTFAELVYEAFEPIALYADRNPAISERLLQTLGRLAAVVRRRADREAIRELAGFVRAAASRHVQDERHRERITRLCEDVGRVLDGRTTGMQLEAEAS